MTKPMIQSMLVTFLFLFFFSLTISAQKVKPTDKSNPKLIYEEFITGFKQAWLELDDAHQQVIDQPDGKELLTTIRKYLSELGFDITFLTISEKIETIKKSGTSCNNVNFRFTWKSDGFEVSDLTIFVSDCNRNWFRFAKPGITIIDYSLERTLLTEWRKLLNHKRIMFDQEKVPQIIRGKNGPTEAAFKDLLDKKGAKDIEGVYELMKEPGESALVQKLKIGVEKLGDINYTIHYFSGALFKADWTDGEHKGEMVKTGKKDFYKVNWKGENKMLHDEVFCSSAEQGVLVFKFVESTGTKERRFLKLYPVF